MFFSCIGALYVVFITFIQETLGSKTQDLGFLAVCIGLGLFVGTILYGKIGAKFCILKTMNISFFISGAYIVFFSAALERLHSSLFAMAAVFFLGVIVSPIVIGGNSLIHTDSNKRLWGRIFSSLEVVIHFFFLVCMFISSFLAEKFSSYIIIISVGSIIAFLSIYNLIKERGVDDKILLEE